MVMGLWTIEDVKYLFSLGHRLLNFQSRVSPILQMKCFTLFYLSLHHPLTLFFGAYITPHISSNLIGFLLGLIFVIDCVNSVYEIHLRIPLLKFSLFQVNRR